MLTVSRTPKHRKWWYNYNMLLRTFQAICEQAIDSSLCRYESLKRYKQGKECARMNLNNQQDNT